ncbi:MAG: hypothetical protein K0U72_02860 [Gammaproteobacteria bacterium]|nr:hypothetical protein [Gammaproteobacteria bacterium]
MKKLFVIVFGLILIVLLTFAVWNQESDPKVETDTDTPRTVATDAGPPPDALVNMPSDQVWSPETEREVVNWQRAHGHYYVIDALNAADGYSDEFELTHPYTAYDNATLSQLADSGDLDALVMLADRLGVSDRNSSNRLHVEAAARGSTYSMFVISSAFTEPDIGGTDEELHTYNLSSLAWLQAAIQQGDLGAIVAFNVNAPAYLDDNDRKYICQKAGTILADLSQQRSHLGLPPFDSNGPDVPDEYREQQMNQAMLICP